MSEGQIVCLDSWTTGKWGVCSRTCGGGQQTRNIRCMRKVTYQREEVAAHSLCSVMAPAQLQPCNTQACPPEWSTGSWSQVCLHKHVTYNITSTGINKMSSSGVWLKSIEIEIFCNIIIMALLFQINCVFEHSINQRILKSHISTKILSSSTSQVEIHGFNMDNNKKYKNYAISWLANQDIWMISKGSCDTEDWNNVCWQFSFAITRIN